MTQLEKTKIETVKEKAVQKKWDISVLIGLEA